MRPGLRARGAAALSPSRRPAPSTSQLNERLSRVVYLALTTDDDGVVTVGEIMDRVAERGYGLLLFLVALPAMIPVLPPGASGVAGMMYMALGAQMVAGKTHPWLPRRVRAYSLTPKVAAALQTKGVSIMERLERLTRPRMTFLQRASMVRALGVLIIVVGFVMWLPLPFMNTAPAIALLLIGIGLLNRDGVFVIAGSLLAASALTFVTVSANLLVNAIGEIIRWIRDVI